jgi:cytochrome d ubiquinol oxidase subunit II
MFPLEIWLAGVIMISLTMYVLAAGADFGGGVWDMLATGARAKLQRETIAEAIGPIWEANHVWLILVVVLLFVAFPVAYAVISTALHIPITIMLIGIVLRGSAFVFRAYDEQSDEVQRRWGRLFAGASVVTPIMLGICVGAIASGDIRVDVETGLVQTDFFSSWLAPFPVAIGFLTLALFAFLAAIYLTLETDDPALQEDFRRRALGAAVAVGLFAGFAFLFSAEGAPLIRQGLAEAWWSLPFQLFTGVVATSTLWAVWGRYYQQARILAMIQVTMIIWGWGLAQFPYIVEPDLTFSNTATSDNVMRLVLIALVAGAVLLVPSLWYLFQVFKGQKGEEG